MTEEWRSKYPNVVTTRTFRGSEVLAGKFRGEADKLLYQLKNLMTFRDLKQLKMTRLFTDGTILTAWSVFGHDFVKIDTTKTMETVLAVEECTVTLYDLPAIVQPMRYPGQIHAGEVEGIDYIKTYYSVNTRNCDWCGDVQFNLCLIEPECRPFYFADDSLPYYDDPDVAIDDHNNHCQYTLAACQAEVIEQGEDELGTYILWKAYTEYAPENQSEVDFARTGLGWMKIEIYVRSPSVGPKLCLATSEPIKVDCCEKDSSLRTVQIWDESTLFGEGRDSVFIGGDIFYKTPSQVNLSDLYLYSLGGSGAFFVFPEGFGGCLPITWTMTGPGSFEIVGGQGVKTKEAVSVSYILPDDWATACQNQQVVISVQDRCGSQDSFSAKPCCEIPGALEIGYTSLVMSCGDQQIFSVGGGCAPYSWSITAGGGSLTGENSSTPTYTAPATNVNCLDNPTIEVTDCCGNSEEIELAINCGGTGSSALNLFVLNGPYDCHFDPIEHWWDWWAEYWRYTYDCAGNLIGTEHQPYGHVEFANCPSDAPFSDDDDTTCYRCCAAFVTCASEAPCYQVCGLIDYRTAEQKAAGCCPLNPLTGLPY